MPAGVVPISSALFKAAPRNVVVLPVLFESQVKAVIELASVNEFTPLQIMFLEQLTASIGIVLNSIEATMQTEGLLKQSQQLAGELQTQQRELQQTNEQLEQKAQQLAERNVEVERKNQEIQQARRELEEKAAELALTSKYKSEFLANMSHELRTPLNSILILGQQLADNPDGNLTGKQTEFARTIHGAGTDLLNLISDILDLSKIESGTVTVEAEEIFFSNLLDAVGRPFRHEADNKQLSFNVELDPALGRSLITDSKRVQQVLKNLLSNAFKFTDQGGIQLKVSAVAGGWTVGHPVLSQAQGRGGLRSRRHRHRHPARETEDHLRGVPAGRRQHQPQIRRHRSRPGDQPRTVEPARRRDPAAQLARHAAAHSPSTCRSLTPGPRTPALRERRGHGRCRRRGFIRRAAGARGRADPGRPARNRAGRFHPARSSRTIRTTAACWSTSPATRASRSWWRCAAPTRSSSPSNTSRRAVSLDVFLPDMLGWSVLSQLKQNPLTRHIPVQIITLDEDRHHGLARGAFSFVTKPTTPEGVDAALSRIKEYAAPRRKRLLVVEDNPAEQMSIKELLGHDDVEIETAGTGHEALASLRRQAADCVVLDLRLPDMTGFEVLEELRADASLSEVPVVVFTGRELSAEEDAQLHTMARSIVVKGVESPERLLDETALFLHRVVTELPAEKQRMLERSTGSDEDLVGRTVLLVDDDARNIFALSAACLNGAACACSPPRPARRPSI